LNPWHQWLADISLFQQQHTDGNCVCTAMFLWNIRLVCL